MIRRPRTLARAIATHAVLFPFMPLASMACVSGASATTPDGGAEKSPAPARPYRTETLRDLNTPCDNKPTLRGQDIVDTFPTTLTATFTPRNGAGVDATVSVAYGATVLCKPSWGGLDADHPEVGSRIELDAQVTISTPDRALSDTFVARFWKDSSVGLRGEVAVAARMGSLAPGSALSLEGSAGGRTSFDANLSDKTGQIVGRLTTR